MKSSQPTDQKPAHAWGDLSTNQSKLIIQYLNEYSNDDLEYFLSLSSLSLSSLSLSPRVGYLGMMSLGICTQYSVGVDKYGPDVPQSQNDPQ